MSIYVYQEMFPLGEDTTEYRLLTKDYVCIKKFRGKKILEVAPEGLKLLTMQAFKDASYMLGSSHIQKLAQILSDPESSDNDKFVVLELLKNVVISTEGVFPMCQDTGTAIIIGRKGQQVWTDYNDEKVISEGVYKVYVDNYLRYSQNIPLTLYEEENSGCNLPAQIDLFPVTGDEYNFLFIAKGGGSANKTFLYQESQPIINHENLLAFMQSKSKYIGTAACPPYHLVFVIGGTSAEVNLKAVKLASSGYLDNLATTGNDLGHAFRDIDFETKFIELAHEMGIGAQFGGKYFCHDVRVIRLPRHGGSCPIGLGLSCSAHRNIKGKITKDGIFLEKLETDPSQYLPLPEWADDGAVKIDVNRPMNEIRAVLHKYPVATRLLLSGDIVVARDIAHAKIKNLLEMGESMPQYFKDHILYYAGPAKIPDGFASGSFGPTTGGRMDPYVPLFQKQGGSLITLAKGNRSKAITESCKKYGGFYLGSIGGAAARFGKECITSMEVIEYPELGMEAIYKITVKDFPAFIIVDDKGNDFFDSILNLPFAFSVRPHIT